METTSPVRRLLIVGLLLFCAGCKRGAGVQRAAVGGDVTLDGVSVVEGSIAFYPCGETNGPVAGGVIQAGHYYLKGHQGPAVGANRVEVSSRKKTGRTLPTGEVGVRIDEEMESIPERYNTNSTLVVEIKPGKNLFSCELTSK